MTTFAEANKTIHPVETQWHYPILMQYGFEAKTKEAIGFVRSYKYVHPESKETIICTTGASADYWETNEIYGNSTFWSDLDPYLKNKYEPI